MKRQLGMILAGLAMLAGAAVLAPIVSGLAQQQRDWSQEQLKTEPVRGNIYMITGIGGNIGVSVGPDGILIVDDKYLPLADKIRAALTALGGGKLKFILNTHWHGDHTGANPAFGAEVPIIAQTNVRERLKTGAPDRKIEATPKEGWPVITFDQSLSVHFNGEEIKVIHFPHGHTDGDAVIFFTGSNVVHLGDDFFAGHFPYVDLDSGGDAEGLAKNIGELIPKIPADAKIIPGHGPLSTLDDLKSYHVVLMETIDIVRQKMKAGKTLDQIKAEGLPEKYKSWAWNFVTAERWIETIHRSLSGQRPLHSQVPAPADPLGHGHPFPPPK